MIVESTVKVIAFSLLHSLWVVPACVVVLEVILFATRSLSALLRYRLAQCTLLFAIILPIAMAIFSIAHTMAQTSGMPPTTAEYISDSPVSHTLKWEFNASALLAIWGTVFFALLTRLGIGLRQLYLLEQTTFEPHRKLTDRVVLLSIEVGLQSLPKIRVSSELNSPFVYGIFQSVLVIPHNFYASMGSSKAELVIRHELGHIYHRDGIAVFLEALIKSMLFFNPGIYTLLERIECERECAADTVAATDHKERYALARALGHLVNRTGPGHTLALTRAALGGLPERLRILGGVRDTLYDRRIRFRRMRVIAALMCFGAIGLGVALTAKPHKALTSSFAANEALEDSFEKLYDDAEKVFDEAAQVFDDAERVFKRAEIAFGHGEYDRGQQLTRQAETIHKDAERIHSRAERLHGLAEKAERNSRDF